MRSEFDDNPKFGGHSQARITHSWHDSSCVMAPDRNAPCPCGSGKKMKKCCGVGGIYQRGLNARIPEVLPPPEASQIYSYTTTSGRRISDMSIAPPTMEELAARMNDATIVDEEDVIAQMKRLAEGYEFEVDGRDGRGDASWWLYEHYSAKPDGTRLEEERFPGIEALPGFRATLARPCFVA